MKHYTWWIMACC